MQQRPPPRSLTADGIRLAAVPTAPSCARLFVRNALIRWRLLFVAENAELVVSELVTNAVCATGMTDTPLSYPKLADVAVLTVRLSVIESYLRIEVWDSSPELPRRQMNDLESEHGRGLLLVEALARRCGALPAPDQSGKVVWADLALDPTPATSRNAAPLPKRPAQPHHSAARPAESLPDVALLERVLMGLQRLGQSQPGGVRAVDRSLFSD
jgi:histidine kinase-like protein